jgi:hypothetical protein
MCLSRLVVIFQATDSSLAADMITSGSRAVKMTGAEALCQIASDVSQHGRRAVAKDMLWMLSNVLAGTPTQVV